MSKKKFLLLIILFIFILLAGCISKGSNKIDKDENKPLVTPSTQTNVTSNSSIPQYVSVSLPKQEMNLSFTSDSSIKKITVSEWSWSYTDSTNQSNEGKSSGTSCAFSTLSLDPNNTVKINVSADISTLSNNKQQAEALLKNLQSTYSIPAPADSSEMNLMELELTNTTSENIRIISFKVERENFTPCDYYFGHDKKAFQLEKGKKLKIIIKAKVNSIEKETTPIREPTTNAGTVKKDEEEKVVPLPINSCEVLMKQWGKSASMVVPGHPFELSVNLPIGETGASFEWQTSGEEIYSDNTGPGSSNPKFVFKNTGNQSFSVTTKTSKGKTYSCNINVPIGWPSLSLKLEEKQSRDPLEVSVTPLNQGDCSEFKATTTATPKGGKGNYTYAWQGVMIGQATQTALKDKLTPGHYETFVKVTDEGVPQQVTLTVTGPVKNASTQLTYYDLEIDWGDGSPLEKHGPGNGNGSFVHTYNVLGTYTIKVTISDATKTTKTEKINVSIKNETIESQTLNIDVKDCAVAAPACENIDSSGLANAVSLHANNANANRINLVFVNHGYTEEEFEEALKTAIDYSGTYTGIFAFEPFKSNKNLFNIWKLNAIQTIPYAYAEGQKKYNGKFYDEACSAYNSTNGQTDIINCINNTLSKTKQFVPTSRNLVSIGLYNKNFRSSAIINERGTAVSFPHYNALTYTALNNSGVEETKVSPVTVSAFCGTSSNEYPYCVSNMDADGDGCIEPEDIQTLQNTPGGVKDWDNSGSTTADDLIIGFVCARRVSKGCTNKMPLIACNGHTLGEVDQGLSIVHELGHLLPLSDEYSSFTPEVNFIGNNCFQGTISACLTLSENPKWGNLLGQPDGMGGTIGCFEGCAGNTTGYYRPTQTSIMENIYPSFSYWSSKLNFGKVNERELAREIKDILIKGPCYNGEQFASLDAFLGGTA